jgi:hypothetical protein
MKFINKPEVKKKPAPGKPPDPQASLLAAVNRLATAVQEKGGHERLELLIEDLAKRLAQPRKPWKFTVHRGVDGLIKSVEAE